MPHFNVSIAIINHAGQLDDIVRFETRNAFDTREIIDGLCNGWQMSVNRALFINGHFIAYGNPREIRTALAEKPLGDVDTLRGA